jgi:hypothetical protein
MLFANSVMLWGLLAISVPVIIHLFNLQRYKKVYFTNVRFLQQLQQQSRRQSVLRHWLALLFRILVIIFLVLAFAKPFIPSAIGTSSEAESATSIYIDNSFSMETEGRSGFLIDDAIAKAKDIKASHSRADKFNLLTNEFSGIHHRMVSADELGTFIDDVSISPAVRDLRDVLGRQYDILNREPATNKSVYLISDFQRNIATFEGFVPDTNIRHFMIHLEPSRYANLSVDTCWFETPTQQPGQVVQLNVTITNHGENPVEKIPVKLVVNGSQRALTSLDINAGESVTETLSFTIRETGIHQGFVEINDYPITFDDRLYFSFRVLPAINILSIFDQTPGSYLRALFGPDTLFRFAENNFRQLNYAEVHRQQLIILNGLGSVSSGLATEIGRFVENGGSLLIIPAQKIDSESYVSWMRTLNTVVFSGSDTTRIRMADLNLLHPLYKDVFETQPGSAAALSAETDLPWVSNKYRFSLPPRKDVQTLISLRNAEPFLIADRYGEGNIYVMASPLEVQATTFPIHAIFVPTLYRMALLSTPLQKIYNIVGTQESMSIGNMSPGTGQVFNLASADGQLKFIPGHRTVNYSTHLYALDAIETAGNYHLTSDQDTLMVLSFNYDRRESLPEYLSVQELHDMAESAGFTNFAVVSESERPVGQVINELSRGKQLWKYFIIAALVFLLAEILALRFLP